MKVYDMTLRIEVDDEDEMTEDREDFDAPHVHDFQPLASWPSGPDGETTTLSQCSCSAHLTTDSLFGSQGDTD